MGIDAFFRLCPHCRVDLCAAPIVWPDEGLRDHLLKAQRQLWELIRQPFFRHPRLGTVASAKIFQTFVERRPDDQQVSAELGTSYRGINFRRLLMNHFMDAVTFFAKHPCLPTLANY